jgi:hypothetical protein
MAKFADFLEVFSIDPDREYLYEGVNAPKFPAWEIIPDHFEQLLDPLFDDFEEKAA